MSSRRILVSLLMLAKDYSRRRVTLILMFVLPTLSFFSVYGGMPATSIPVDVVENQVSAQVEMDQRDVTGSFIVLSYAALLGGLTGLFLMQSGRATDQRLVLCGYRPAELTFARSIMLMVMCLAISAYLTAMLIPFLHPRHVPAYFLSVMEIALIYGSFGAIIGTLITQELGGIFAIVMFPQLDVGWLEIPGFSSVLDQWWARLLPAFYPSKISVDAAFTPTLDTLGEWWVGFVYAAVLWVVATGTFARATHVHRFGDERGAMSLKVVLSIAVAGVLALALTVWGVLYYMRQPATVEADGRVTTTEADVTANTSGRITMLLVDQGDTVVRDQVIAWVEDLVSGTSLPVYAPIEGTVTKLTVKAGQNVNPGALLATVHDLVNPEVKLEVDESSIAGVEVGLPVALRFAALNQEIKGRVTEISRVPLPPESGVSEQRRRIRKYAVTVEILEEAPNLSIEMAVRGKIFLNEQRPPQG